MAKLRLMFNYASVARYSANCCQSNYQCKLLVVGGGAGGCSVAARFARKLRNNDIIVLEPSHVHYYQPLFTLVAAGIKEFSESHRPQKSVLPPNVRWVAARAAEFDPCNNTVYTASGDIISYEYMVVAVGLVNDYDKVPGLQEALNNPKSGVCTIYAPEYCQKARECVRGFKGGHALFTFPRDGSKCSGAAQKIMYLAEDYWTQNKIRDVTNITYVTGGGAIFGVPKYARALSKVAANRCIAVNCCVELLEVGYRTAVFQDESGQVLTLPYNLLHVTPPMSPPSSLRRCSGLVTARGYLDVDHRTLRHRRFANVFGLGDCLATPNSKTAAAVAQQSSIVEQNLHSVMVDEPPAASYSGYGACPLLTSYKSGILAEFVYDKEPCETFPFDQSKERRFFYFLKTNILPYIYWNKLLKGTFNGPAQLRKIINPFAK